jgi:hypothetical protein
MDVHRCYIENCDFIFLVPISLGIFFILSVVTSHFVIQFCDFHCHYHQYHLTNVETHHSYTLSYMIHIQRCIICDPYITFVTRFVTFFYHPSYVTCARWMIIFCHFLRVSSTYIYTLCKSTFFFVDEWIDLDLDMCFVVLNYVLGFFFHRIDNFIPHGKDK